MTGRGARRVVSPLLLAVVVALSVAVVTVLAALAPSLAGTFSGRTSSGRVDVFFVPHPDDELLSMSVLIYDRTRAGDDVWLVNYADGSGSQVCGKDARRFCTRNEFAGEPASMFVQERRRELIASAVALGVPLDHVVTGDSPAPGLRLAADGHATFGYAEAVRRAWSRRLPTAHEYAMSWIDGNPDHRAMGLALLAAVESGRLPAERAHFTMFRTYWQYDHPGLGPTLEALRDALRRQYGVPTSAAILRCRDDACRRAIRQAEADYHTPYVIGYRSVELEMDDFARDPATLVHGPGRTWQCAAGTRRFPASLDDAVGLAAILRYGCGPTSQVTRPAPGG